MATGLFTYMDDPDSTVLVDMTVSYSQIMGSVESGATNGSITVSAAPNGKSPMITVSDLAPDVNGNGKRPGVTFTIIGDRMTVTWRYSYRAGFGNFAMPVLISYGYY